MPPLTAAVTFISIKLVFAVLAQFTSASLIFVTIRSRFEFYQIPPWALIFFYFAKKKSKNKLKFLPPKFPLRKGWALIRIVVGIIKWGVIRKNMLYFRITRFVH
jgi:hypothetical protein